MKEPQTKQIQDLVYQDGDLVALWGALIEGYLALARLRREQILTDEEELQSRQFYLRLSSQWSEVRPSNLVRDQASRVLLLHPLRATDALQLAAASFGPAVKFQASNLSVSIIGCGKPPPVKGFKSFRNGGFSLTRPTLLIC